MGESLYAIVNLGKVGRDSFDDLPSVTNDFFLILPIKLLLGRCCQKQFRIDFP
jgi:hypothetical protein